MKQIYTLSYVSRCLLPPETQTSEMKRLVAVSTKNNAIRYISGLLTLQDDQFFQVIEGEQKEIGRTFDAIRRDMRHTDIRLIAEKELPERQFPRWIFGVVGTSPEAKAYFSEITDQSYLSSHDELSNMLHHLASIDTARRSLTDFHD
ncbi:MAG: BLUF domain-containing protein [Xanthobacteraceae bacterium]|nr:BLUF domain-containing protein [Xanthobacteraceae bacterium]